MPASVVVTAKRKRVQGPSGRATKVSLRESATPLLPACPLSGISALAAALVWSARGAVHVLLLNEVFRVLGDELRRRVFAPRLERKNINGEASVVPMPSKFPFSWVPIVWRMRDEDLLDEVGIDAVIYYSFIRLCIIIMVPAALFDLSIVLWANTTGNNHLDQRVHSDLDPLSMANVPQGSPRFWAHFFSVLLKSVLCLKLLDRHSQWICKVQLKELTQQRAGCPETYTILVTDIPADSPPVSEKFGAIWGGDFAASTPIVHTAVLDKLVARRDELRGLLENAVWHSENPPKKEPKKEGAGKADPGANRPTHRTGPLGLWGERVDSISAYTKELQAVEARCTAIRRGVLGGSAVEDAPIRSAAFVAFFGVREATLAAQVQHTEDPFTWRVQPAMAPEDVYWPNVGRLDFFQKQTASNVAFAVVMAIVLFWMIPVALVQSLATLSNLAKVLPFLESAFEDPTVKSIIEGVLPGLALIIFMALLPALMRKISQLEGIHSLSMIDASQLRKLFIFGAVNVFFGNIVAGSVFNSIETLVENPEGSLETIGSAVPATSRFFMAYILLNSLAGAAALISGGVKSIIYMLRKKLLGKTPRGEAACWAPRAAELGVVNCDTAVFFMLIVIFTTLQPVMHVIGFVYLIPRFVAAKMQVLFLHEKDHEGRGMLWPVLRGRVVAAMIIYQVTMAITLALKLAPAQAVLTVLLAPFTLVFKRKMDSRYNWVLGGTIPLEVVTGQTFMDAENSAEESVMPFLHPALRPEGGLRGSVPKQPRPSNSTEADEEYGHVSGRSRKSQKSGRSDRHMDGRRSSGHKYRGGSASYEVQEILRHIPEKGSKRGEDLVRASIEENPTSVRGGAGGVTALSTQSLRPGRPDDASDDNAPVESAACGPAGGKGNGKGGPN